MKVACELSELSTSALLLPLGFRLSTLLVMAVEISANFFVLGLDVPEVLLPRVEVVLILATVESTIAAHRTISTQLTKIGAKLTISEQSWPVQRRTCLIFGSTIGEQGRRRRVFLDVL